MADLLGSSIDAGRFPADNSAGQYWNNIAPKEFDNMEQAAALAFATTITNPPTQVVPDTFGKVFYQSTAGSLMGGYLEFTVGDCTGGEDVPEGDFFCVQAGSDFNATGGFENLFLEHDGRLPQSSNVAEYSGATLYNTRNRYCGFAGVITGSDLPASAVIRVGVGVDGGHNGTQFIRVGPVNVYHVPASERTVTGNLVPHPQEAAGVFATKWPANISYDSAGQGTVETQGLDFAALDSELVVAAIGDSWANNYSGAGAYIEEWMTKFGRAKLGISCYGDARGGRTLADMDSVVDELLTMDVDGTRPDSAGFGFRECRNRILPNNLLLQGGSYNSMVAGQTAVQMLASLDLIVDKAKAASIHILIGNMAGAIDTYTAWPTIFQDTFDDFNAGVISVYSADSDVTLIDHSNPPVGGGLSADWHIPNQEIGDPGHLNDIGSQNVSYTYSSILYPSSANDGAMFIASPISSFIK